MVALIAISIAIGITMLIFSVGIVALVVVVTKDKGGQKTTPQVPPEINIPLCPICGTRLTFMMPSGTTLHCNRCNKCFKNSNGTAGEECESPYTRNDVQY